MPCFRCEFEVDADMVLADDKSIVVTSASGAEITLTNGPPDEDGYITGLVAAVVGQSDSIETADMELREALAEHLDLLAFCTHTSFAIRSVTRIVDWEPGAKDRQLRFFKEWRTRYPPDPELVPEYALSAQLLDQLPLPPFVRTALKYFRYGLLERQPEDQFMRFWLALEVVAESTKESERVPIHCPACRASLSCKTCGTEPTRAPMAKQAIDGIVRSIASAAATGILKRQFVARNGLMHGRSIESIERETKVSMADLVNELGKVTWHSIMRAMPAPPKDSQMVFGHRDGQFVNTSMCVAVHGKFRHDGADPHPPLSRIPTMSIKQIVQFKRPEGDEPGETGSGVGS